MLQRAPLVRRDRGAHEGAMRAGGYYAFILFKLDLDRSHLVSGPRREVTTCMYTTCVHFCIHFFLTRQIPSG